VRLRVKDLEFNDSSIPVPENVCMELGSSEILWIVVPNGAGKSTLILSMNRIRHGSILLDGEKAKYKNMIKIAKRFGYVPQSSSRTFPTTVFDTVLMGRRPRWRSSKNDLKKVVEVLKLMEIEDLSMRVFNELSGGQQQKVLIARALAQEPDILLLDEPTSNLDIHHQLEVMEIIRELVAKRGISAIMAIHDLNLASRFADKIIIMKNGKIIDAGKPWDVLTPENIRKVYNVEVEVLNSNGRPYIVSIKSIKPSPYMEVLEHG